MELNNRQSVEYSQYGAVSTDLTNVYFILFIYFIVEHNDPKSVQIFA